MHAYVRVYRERRLEGEKEIAMIKYITLEGEKEIATIKSIALCL